MKDKVILTTSIIVIILLAVLLIRFFTGSEDTWLCEDGKWIKHGSPSSSMPKQSCDKSNQGKEPNEEIEKQNNKEFIDNISSNKVWYNQVDEIKTLIDDCESRNGFLNECDNPCNEQSEEEELCPAICVISCSI